MKVKFLMTQAALEIDPNARMADLAKAAKVSYSTLLWATQNNVSSAVAEKSLQRGTAYRNPPPLAD
ncbi:endolysin [Salmonella phage 37]|uniref:Endolysin n=1 Tax=Salmonella phage 37 TaxID=1654890 RepID=A0A0N7C9U0_9CAUD|nr:endolysin [Salmonella phage 37]AKJ73871.1 endolysin [Salmonella phage 37]